MLTRDTHARIYQGELPDNKYGELGVLAKQKGVSLHELILEAIRGYLEKGKPKFSLDVEEVALKSGDMRFYLWLPYEILEEIDHLIKNKGIFLHELVRKALMEHYKTELGYKV